MMSGRYTYQDLHSLNNVGKVALKIPKNLNLSEPCKSFLECCLQLKAYDRYSINDLKTHPFIHDPIPYFLKYGLTFEDGDWELWHGNKKITEQMNQKIIDSQNAKVDVMIEHALKLV